MVAIEVSENAKHDLKNARIGKTPTPKLFAAAVWWFAGLPKPLRMQLMAATRRNGGMSCAKKAKTTE